jgi:signal transduction histidine kinase
MPELPEPRTVLATTPAPEGMVAALAWLPEPALLLEGDRVVVANPAAAALLGADPASLACRSVADFLPFDLFGQVDGATPARRAEHSILHADGTELRVEVTLAPWPAPADRSRRLLLIHDVTQHQRRHDALMRSQARLRRLTARRDAIQRSDRLRFAHRLHDTLQQPLAAMLYELQAAAIPEETTPNKRPTFARVSDLVIAALRSTTEVIDELQPLIVEELGVVDALAALAHRFESRTGIRCSLRTNGLPDDAGEVPMEHRALVYDALREALDNVVHHAGASRVRVELAQGHGQGLRLRVQDDGVGVRRATLEPWALGLLGLQERARALGGELAMRQARPRGTTLHLDLPPADAKPGA